MIAAAPRKPPVFGSEAWSELTGQPWSYWDLWFAAVAVWLYRAFHTAGLELADRTDDSHGNVGELRRVVPDGAGRR